MHKEGGLNHNSLISLTCFYLPRPLFQLQLLSAAFPDLHGQKRMLPVRGHRTSLPTPSFCTCSHLSGACRLSVTSTVVLHVHAASLDNLMPRTPCLDRLLPVH